MKVDRRFLDEAEANALWMCGHVQSLRKGRDVTGAEIVHLVHEVKRLRRIVWAVQEATGEELP